MLKRLKYFGTNRKKGMFHPGLFELVAVIRTVISQANKMIC